MSFEDLSDPILRAIRHCYHVRRVRKKEDVPWSGPEIGEGEQANSLQAAYRLSAEALAYSLDDQGRNAMEEIVGLAIQLGIEQGRRIARSDTAYQTLKIKADLSDLLLEKLNTKDHA